MMPVIAVINGVLLALSSSLAASIVLKVTVTLALGLIAARLARRSRAAVRHALLAAVFGVLMVLPIASLVAPAVRISVPAPAPPSVNDRERVARVFAAEATPSAAAAHPSDGVASVVASVATPAVTSAAQSTGLPRSPRLSTSALLLAIWIAGTALFLLPMAIGLWQVRRLRRSAVPWLHGQSVLDNLARDAGIHRRVEMRLHGESLGPPLLGPMTCGVVHPAIVLPKDAQTWDQDDLHRAIVHELEHVRRADWVSHCLARAICAAYWFHPLVWIAWRRFVLEAERSCDDAVLEHSEATPYADQLVALARRLSLATREAARATTAKSPLLAMANRADLATRVGAVLDTRQRRGRAGMLSVALACASAVALVLIVSPLRMVAAQRATNTSAITDISVAPTPPPAAIAAVPPPIRVATIPAPVAIAPVPQAPSPLVGVAPIPAPVAIAAAPQAPAGPIRVLPIPAPGAIPAVPQAPSPLVRVAPMPAPVAIAAAPQAPAMPVRVGPMLAPLALAAEPQAPATPAGAPVPRFHGESTLVIVDATVRDNGGNPIEGLTANDFVITEDGVPQRIMVFEFQKLAQTIGIQSSVSSYYILGYYTKNSNLDGGYRKIEITKKSDAMAKLDFRAGYYARSRNVASGPAQDDADRTAALDLTQPVLITKYEPEYSEEARKAKWQGTVRIDVVVDEHGVPIDLKITRALGMGLDQKAMEAVWKWRFKPATKDGKPVTSQAQVDVEFRLF